MVKIWQDSVPGGCRQLGFSLVWHCFLSHPAYVAATDEAGLQQAKDISRQTTTLRRASLPHPLSILPPPTP